MVSTRRVMRLVAILVPLCLLLMFLLSTGKSGGKWSRPAGVSADEERTVRREAEMEELVRNAKRVWARKGESPETAAASVTHHPGPAQTAHVLIMAIGRSGSSFLSQLFNQHPRLFFQFEPLKLADAEPARYPDKVALLRHFFKCEFDRVPTLVDFLDAEPLHRVSSKPLISPPLCTVHFSGKPTQRTAKSCQHMQTEPLMKVCRSRQHQAIKIIRIRSLASLERLALDDGINLKIVHLVRDPRGTYMSLVKAPTYNISLEQGVKFDAGIRYICKRLKNNLDFARTLPQWLQSNYKLVRFEDAARRPQILAKEVYNFTGIGPLPIEVSEWIEGNTNTTSKNDGIHSTSRDSSGVPEAWRNKAPFQAVLRMQELCGETLRDLGYREVKTQEELVDRRTSLVGPLPPHILP